jgi:preprotein translocase subunit SecF
MEFFKIRRTIPFMRYALIFNVISLVTFLAAVYFLAAKGLHLSIEFTGGTVVQIQYPAAPDLEKLRTTLAKGGYPDDQVQNFGSAREVLIRIPLKKGEQSSNVADDAMFKLASPVFQGKIEDRTDASLTELDIAYPRDKPPQEVRELVDRAGLDKGSVSVTQGSDPRHYVIRVVQQQNSKATPRYVAERLSRAVVIDEYDGKLLRAEFVGPQIGAQMAEHGALALLLTAVGIVVYLAVRFEWRFGLSAIIANLHDVVIILGCFALFQWEFSLAVLAAVLAILGYSVNESVVVFDRVRENFRKMRRASTPEVIDSAITAVISRTIITHGCTQMMATMMLAFGGPALHYFALALTIGICFGIYSSVLVASPLLMWLGVKREHLVKPTRNEPGPGDEL